MLKLATEFKKAGVKFRWTIFTDLSLYNQKPFNLEEITYMKPSHNFFDYVVEADYGVQLSDTEGYSYFINECLQYRTPVICTNFPSAYESVEDGTNGYILDMNLSNLDIDKLINNIPKNFKYEEKCKEKDWIDLIDKKIKGGNKMKIRALIDYKDKELNKDITKGDIYDVSMERANVILNAKYNGQPYAEAIEEIETAKKEVKAETAIKKVRKKNK